MKIFKDVFSGDELFSDTYKIQLIDDCLYEVYGKHVTRTEGDIQLEGANASAEEADEGTDSSSVSGVDIILNHRLTQTGFGTKKDYMTYLKGYMAKVTKHMEENGKADKVDAFKANINKVMKELLGKFKDLDFYCGESMDPEAMVLILDYKEVDGVEHPVILAFKDGLDEEKC
uniref:Translationally-controlled tumor protein homolog n=1 Tax=Acartia pacifica TaxID=335913 RepID=R9TFQ7_ACAPC|nr:translationally-controlled tumor-like protein [Acartia pacifica]